MVFVGGHIGVVVELCAAHLLDVGEGGIETVERGEERAADVLLLVLVAHLLAAFVRHEEAQQQASVLDVG